MARSSYVYIAYNHANELLGAFTVKHELITRADRAAQNHIDYRFAKVYRVKDGSVAGEPEHRCVDITREILDEIA